MQATALVFIPHGGARAKTTALEDVYRRRLVSWKSAKVHGLILRENVLTVIPAVDCGSRSLQSNKTNRDWLIGTHEGGCRLTCKKDPS